MRAGWRLRAGVLVALGVLGVHEARWRWGESEAGAALAEPGHGYLELAPTAAVVLAALGAMEVLVAIARARAGAATPQGAAFHVRWAAATAVLLGAHLAHEVADHVAAGLDAMVVLDQVLGGGLWVAAIACAVAGALVALALCGADSALRTLAGRSKRPSVRRPPPDRSQSPQAPAFRRPSVMSLALAGRAPPR